MRSVLVAMLCLACFAACKADNTPISPVTVQWMDWPAVVDAGQPFRTRIVVWGICASNPRFREGVSADLSAVTFAPYFLIDNDPIFCAGAAATSFVITAIDTAGTAPGLAATFSRTYEMRGTTSTNTRALGLLGPLPVRTFGEVTVGPPGADPSRRNAAGTVRMETDSQGCVRVRPVGLYHPGAALVLEDQADTVGLTYSFVRGYIHDAAAPVCGETRVFHLVTRN
jgi:hypothetical protein